MRHGALVLWSGVIRAHSTLNLLITECLEPNYTQILTMTFHITYSYTSTPGALMTSIDCRANDPGHAWSDLVLRWGLNIRRSWTNRLAQTPTAVKEQPPQQRQHVGCTVSVWPGPVVPFAGNRNGCNAHP